MPLSPTAAVLLAISFGLCGGYLDLVFMVFKKYCWNERGYFRIGEGFPLDRPGGPRGSVADPRAGGRRREPASAETRLAARGVVAVRDARDLGGPAEDAAVRRLQPAPGRRAGPADRRRGRGPWPGTRGAVRYTLAGLLGLLGVLAALSSGRQAIRNTARWPDCRHRPRAPATSC